MLGEKLIKILNIINECFIYKKQLKDYISGESK